MVIQRFRPHFSGQGVQLEQLCQHLARRGVEAHVFTAVRGRRSAVEACDGYAIHRLRADVVPGSAGNSHVWMPTFAARVGAALMRPRSRYDLIHVHALTDALYTAWIASRARAIPIVFEMTLLGDDDPESVRNQRTLMTAPRYALYRRCDAFVAMSRAFLDSYRRAGLPQSRLRLIPQGVDNGRFRPAAEGEKPQLRDRLGLPQTGPVVAFVGSLIQRKGLDLLLRAWTQIHANHPQATLLLIGRDSFEPESADWAYLQEALGSLPAATAARIVRMGERDDVDLLLRAADLFVFPSRREGFGAVIIEAMASGLACIVAELPGITDLIFQSPCTETAVASGQCDGIVVPQENTAALATRIDEMLSDAALRSRIAACARRRAQAAFDFEHVADQYIDLYEHLATKSRSR